MIVRSISMYVQIDHFRSFLPGYGSFTGIKNIKLNTIICIVLSLANMIRAHRFGKRRYLVLKYHTFLRYLEITRIKATEFVLH